MLLQKISEHEIYEDEASPELLKCRHIANTVITKLFILCLTLDHHSNVMKCSCMPNAAIPALLTPTSCIISFDYHLQSD